MGVHGFHCSVVGLRERDCKVGVHLGVPWKTSKKEKPCKYSVFVL